jgi:hypothetical protein
MTHRDYKVRNDMSRNKAKHHSEPWSGEEQDLLRGFWDGTEATLAEIAETLGRTIEACRQKYYFPSGQTKTSHPQHVSGWLLGFCTECGRFTDVFCTGLIQKCEDCRC